MFFAFVLLLLITAGGFIITYFFDEDAPFFARICAGIVIGQVVFSLVGFVLGCLVGMLASIAVLSAVISALPLFILLFLGLKGKLIKAQIREDFSAFVKSIENFVKLWRLEQTLWAAIWIMLMVFLYLFFARAMLNVEGGIGTGSPHNTGDLSFHLQAIYGFLDGQNFPPQNPSYAGGKFTYPFMADLVTALLAAVGARISEAMFWQNMLLIVALIVLMRRFTFKLTDNIFAANIAPLILLFSGGLGFILFFTDALVSEKGVFGFLLNMSNNYTIRSEEGLRWGNSLTVLFMTQRSLLIGLPLALIVLTKVWEIFVGEKVESENGEKTENDGKLFTLSPLHPFTPSLFTVGLLAGTLPLVHAHSFAVVMGMTGLLALMSWRHWREWFVFFASAAVVSVPELLWAMSNSASKAREFTEWKFGWDNDGKLSFVPFWIFNTGLFIPLLLFAIGFLLFLSFNLQDSNAENEQSKIENQKSKIRGLLLFCLPFGLCFIVPNVARLAPWVWDNIKVLIYWFVVSIPLVAWLIAYIWESGQIGKGVAVALLVVLLLSGWLDVWRVASEQLEYVVFERDAVTMARQARQKLPPDAVVASAPTHTSAAALMGRRWFLGFTGHLWSHGIDPSQRENELKEIYSGSPNAENLLRENNIQYLIVSPQEHEFTRLNEGFLRRFPVVAQSGEYYLIQVK